MVFPVFVGPKARAEAHEIRGAVSDVGLRS